MGKCLRQSLIMLGVLVLLCAMLIGCGGVNHDGGTGGTSAYMTEQASPIAQMAEPMDNLASMSGIDYSLGAVDSMDMARYDHLEVALEEETTSTRSDTGNVTNSEAHMPARENRKLITTMHLNAETKEFDDAVLAVEARTKELGGYMESMETYYGSQYYNYGSVRYAYMTIRIPQNQLDNFMTVISGVIHITNENKREEDITLAYVDLASHKDALQTEYDRLVELLAKAESVEDIIAIENRLSDVRYQINSMESRLRTYDNMVDYSTIHLSISEVLELTPVSAETVWERISNGFINSINRIVDGLREIFIWVFSNLPFIIIWAGVIVFIILFVRYSMKRPSKWKKKKETTNVKLTEGDEVGQEGVKKE